MPTSFGGAYGSVPGAGALAQAAQGAVGNTSWLEGEGTYHDVLAWDLLETTNLRGIHGVRSHDMDTSI